MQAKFKEALLTNSCLIQLTELTHIYVSTNKHYCENAEKGQRQKFSFICNGIKLVNISSKFDLFVQIFLKKVLWSFHHHFSTMIAYMKVVKAFTADSGHTAFLEHILI